MSLRRLHLILLAGGQGLRASGLDATPKQFRMTGRGLLFTVSLGEFLDLDRASVHRPADAVVTVPDSWRDEAVKALGGFDIPWELAPSGDSRTASTWNAVRILENKFAPHAEDLVAIHDAARPFASGDLLSRLVQAAAEAGGAIPGVAVPDTIVQSDKGKAKYLDRSSLLAVQTPQVFRWDIFSAAHAWAAGEGVKFTDDGGLMATRGHQPVVIPGEQANWKVTTAGDWRRTADILSSS